MYSLPSEILSMTKQSARVWWLTIKTEDLPLLQTETTVIKRLKAVAICEITIPYLDWEKIGSKLHQFLNKHL